MSLDEIQKCCRRAREHKLSHLKLMTSNDEQPHVKDTENMNKEIKNKRCEFDQDHAVVTNLFKAIDEDKKRFNKKYRLKFEFLTVEDSDSKK